MSQLAKRPIMPQEIASFCATESHQEFTVYRGFNDRIADALVTASRQDEIAKQCPRDKTERFKDPNAANIWYRNVNKQPELYTLWTGSGWQGRSSQLAGIVWFSRNQEVFADQTIETTAAYRMYDVSRGKHLAFSLALAAEQDFAMNHGPQPIWLETDPQYPPAVNLYKRLGFSASHTSVDSDGKSRLFMTRP